MTDIVERLRRPLFATHNVLHLEAADEIERLRVESKEFRDALRTSRELREIDAEEIAKLRKFIRQRAAHD